MVLLYILYMLTYQKYVMYRGKEVHLNDLKPYSNKMVSITCPWCGVMFERYFFKLKQTGSFLCRQCAIADKLSKTLEAGSKNNKLTVLGPSERSGHSICKCECGEITEVANYNFSSGKTQSCGCLKVETMKRVAVHLKDEEHGMWKGGVVSEREKLMSKKVYKDWMKAVFERDGFTCLVCKSKTNKLNTHHIANYADNKDKALNTENGVTVCNKCHRKFHKIYGNKKTNVSQWQEFLATLQHKTY